MLRCGPVQVGRDDDERCAQREVWPGPAPVTSCRGNREHEADHGDDEDGHAVLGEQADAHACPRRDPIAGCRGRQRSMEEQDGQGPERVQRDVVVHLRRREVIVEAAFEHRRAEQGRAG